MKTLVSLLILLFSVSGLALGQKMKKKKGKEPAPAPIEVPKVIPGAPDPSCGEAPFTMESAEIWSVFVESGRTKDFETALMYGPWLACAHKKEMVNVPTYTGKNMLERLADVYEGYALKKSEPVHRTTYLDSAAWAYTQIIERYKDGGTDLFEVYLQRGRFYQKHVDYIDNANDKAMSDYESMYGMDAKRFTELAEGYYVQAVLLSMVGAERKDDALAMIQATEPFASDALKTAYDQIRNKLFSNPEERITFLKEKLKANATDLETLNELYDLLVRTKASDEARDIAGQLYKLDPSYINTVRVADNYESKADYKNAIKFYQEAISKATTNDQKTEVYLNMVDNYVNTGDLITARESARKVLAVNAKSAKAMLAIARIYAQAVSACGFLEREDKVVYWLAMDYAEKAKSFDASVSNYADQQIKSFRSAAPTVEEKFFKAWKDGQKIKVDGSLRDCYKWIGEETTIR